MSRTTSTCARGCGSRGARARHAASRRRSRSWLVERDWPFERPLYAPLARLIARSTRARVATTATAASTPSRSSASPRARTSSTSARSALARTSAPSRAERDEAPPGGDPRRRRRVDAVALVERPVGELSGEEEPCRDERGGEVERRVVDRELRGVAPPTSASDAGTSQGQPCTSAATSATNATAATRTSPLWNASSPARERARAATASETRDAAGAGG